MFAASVSSSGSWNELWIQIYQIKAKSVRFIKRDGFSYEKKRENRNAIFCVSWKNERKSCQKKKTMTNKIGDPHTLPCKTAGAKVYGNRFKAINSIDRLFVNPWRIYFVLKMKPTVRPSTIFLDAANRPLLANSEHRYKMHSYQFPEILCQFPGIPKNNATANLFWLHNRKRVKILLCSKQV